VDLGRYKENWMNIWKKKKDNYISELCIMQWLHSLLADWLANERNYINDPNSKNRLIAL